MFGVHGTTIRRTVTKPIDNGAFPNKHPNESNTARAPLGASFFTRYTYPRPNPKNEHSKGFCGCLSTYSTFALELHKLPTREAWRYALVSFVASQVGAIVWMGCTDGHATCLEGVGLFF